MPQYIYQLVCYDMNPSFYATVNFGFGLWVMEKCFCWFAYGTWLWYYYFLKIMIMIFITNEYTGAAVSLKKNFESPFTM